MSPTQAKPRVLITRAAADAPQLAAVVEGCGGEAVCVPAVQTVPLPLDEPHQAMLLQLADFLAIAFASRHGARLLGHHLEKMGLVLPATCALFAVGPATAAAVAERFGRPAACAPPYTGAGLAAHVGQKLAPNGRVLLPTARQAGQPLAQTLAGLGLRPQRLPLYDTETVAYGAQGPVTAVRGVDYIVFTSPSCVRGYLSWGLPPPRAGLLTLGPTTSAAVRAHGLQVLAEASPSSLEGLCALVKAVLCPTPRP